ncbi:amidase domain-containing protein [Bacillus sp. PS06]|uniref:amidase domain-containing protein n=1 Tax=Bacillus sp. PS06 TaxID=2764176 RepID=UPI0017807E4D|nr:amidase domain-containing protein [Bacillus sp. PS06]MBD8070615.1 amidase domain-containing protein [Bacillus sp. PS06]
MKEQLERLIYSKVQLYVGNEASQRNSAIINTKELDKIKKKQETYRSRSAEIIKCQAECQIKEKEMVNDETRLQYHVHYQYLVKQKDTLYIEEHCEDRVAVYQDNQLITDDEVHQPIEEEKFSVAVDGGNQSDIRVRYEYNRLAAVKYAERWWNNYNPAFKTFEVDCTNYVSQCLHAGGVPMNGYPDQSKGWWMRNNKWSYSWSVAHSLRWHLGGAGGVQAKEVDSPQDLLVGDVICYDFEGDGRFDHTTIVVAKDKDDMPLVNAHTQNSRMRYWAYEDSTAYTPNIKYKFFSIMNG